MNKDFLLNDSKVFCMAPWVHLHSGIQGDIRPCCIANYDEPIGDLSTDTYEEAFNSDAMKQLRVDMLNETENNICRRCNIAEQNNARNGYKIHWNTSYAPMFDVVEKTNPDGSMDDFVLYDIDFRFSNKCNLKCIMCGVHASSAWASDHNKLNDKNVIGMFKPDIELNEVYKQLEQILPSILHINFAGGEPLMMDEHFYIIDRLVEMERFDVALHYNTNFTKLKYKNKNIFDIWDKFDRVVLDISLDMYGQKGEYIRKGIDFDAIVSNIKLLKANYPNIRYKITATLSVFNALDITEFHKYLIENDLIGINDFKVIMLNDPYYLNPKILPDNIKRQVCINIENHIKNLKDLNAGDNIITLFGKISKYIEGDLDKKHHERFKQFVNDIDKIRKQDFVKTFPELKEMIDE